MDNALDLSEVEERRRAELEFVSSAYEPREAWTVPPIHTFDGEGEGEMCLARSSPEVHRRFALDGGVDIRLVLTMPETNGYPVAESSVLSVEASFCHESRSADDVRGDSLRKAAMEHLPRFLDACREAAEENAGCESVFAVMSRADEWIDGDWRQIVQDADDAAAEIDASVGSTPHDVEQNGALDELDRGAQSSQQVLPQQEGMQLHVVSSHHLLNHAPDNFLAKGGKYKLSGLYRFGTPGLAFCLGDRVSVDNFVSALEKKMPQKKFEIVMTRTTNVRIQCWEEATIEQLKAILTEEEFSEMLKIQGSSGITCNSGKGGKNKKGKKRK